MESKIVIVGAGVGGASLAKELAAQGRKVIVLEQGDFLQWGWRKFYVDFLTSLFPKNISKEGVLLPRAFMVGGTGFVALANIKASLSKELVNLGVDLTEEFAETEKELGVSPVPESHRGERTKKIMQAATELGYQVNPMPKCIDFAKCKSCGMCVAGCPYGAKWTPVYPMKEAQDMGVEVFTQMAVEEVIFSGGKVQGVRGIGPNGSFEILTDTVILAAGGLETPVILQKTGLKEAGGNLFADLYVNTFGTIKGISMEPELSMAAVIQIPDEHRGILLSPYLLPSPTGNSLTFRPPLLKNMRIERLDQTFGIMTKIKDDGRGRVNIDGSIEKACSSEDRDRLKTGEKAARKILDKIGCDPNSVYVDRPQGAHPGGTAAIGTIVNKDLESEIRGLYVCDASVLPDAPGVPPIATIISLAKRLCKHLTR